MNEVSEMKRTKWMIWKFSRVKNQIFWHPEVQQTKEGIWVQRKILSLEWNSEEERAKTERGVVGLVIVAAEWEAGWRNIFGIEFQRIGKAWI